MIVHSGMNARKTAALTAMYTVRIIAALKTPRNVLMWTERNCTSSLFALSFAMFLSTFSRGVSTEDDAGKTCAICWFWDTALRVARRDLHMGMTEFEPICNHLSTLLTDDVALLSFTSMAPVAPLWERSRSV